MLMVRERRCGRRGGVAVSRDLFLLLVQVVIGDQRWFICESSITHICVYMNERRLTLHRTCAVLMM